MDGWIKIHRKMLEWGWYTDTNTKVVFLHLLLLANYGEREFMGRKIKPGQCIVTYGKMAKSLGLTIQNVRTSLEHLESTHEINRQITNKYQLITIEKWEKYQLIDEDTNKQLTGNQQSTNNQLTINQQHYKKDKKDKESNNIHSSLIGSITDESSIEANLARMRERIKKVNSDYGVDGRK